MAPIPRVSLRQDLYQFSRLPYAQPTLQCSCKQRGGIAFQYLSFSRSLDVGGILLYIVRSGSTEVSQVGSVGRLVGRSDPKDRQTVNSENIATYYIHSAQQIIALGEIHLPAGSNPIHSHAAPNDDFDFSKDGMSRSVAVAAQ